MHMHLHAALARSPLPPPAAAAARPCLLPSARLVYFIDDMNMPWVDKYDTQSAVELARQLVDYRGWCARTTVASTGACVATRMHAHTPAHLTLDAVPVSLPLRAPHTAPGTTRRASCSRRCWAPATWRP